MGRIWQGEMGNGVPWLLDRGFTPSCAIDPHRFTDLLVVALSNLLNPELYVEGTFPTVA